MEYARNAIRSPQLPLTETEAQAHMKHQCRKTDVRMILLRITSPDVRHGFLSPLSRTQGEHRLALALGHAAQAADVHPFIASIAPQRAQGSARVKVPHPERPIRAAASQQLPVPTQGQSTNQALVTFKRG